jgi:hypothetical protein
MAALGVAELTPVSEIEIMSTTRNLLALPLAAALLSAPFAITANAATNSSTHQPVPAHHTARPAHAVRHAPARTGATTSPDHSADSLNAQSLSQARGQQQ